MQAIPQLLLVHAAAVLSGAPRILTAQRDRASSSDAPHRIRFQRWASETFERETDTRIFL